MKAQAFEKHTNLCRALPRLRLSSHGFVKALVIAGLVLLGGYKLVMADTEEYSVEKVYSIPKTKVVYYETVDGGYKVGVFENGWWLAAGTKPSFSSSDSGWKQLGPSVLVTNLNEDTGALVATPAWSAEATYYGGALVKVGDLCYMSKWWTKGDPPASGGPWQTETCPASSSGPTHGKIAT